MEQRLCADCGRKQDTCDGELHNEGLDVTGANFRAGGSQDLKNVIQAADACAAA